MALDNIEQWNANSEKVIQQFMEMLRSGIPEDLLKEVYTGVMRNIASSEAEYVKMYSDIPMLVDMASARVQRERGLT